MYRKWTQDSKAQARQGISAEEQETQIVGADKREKASSGVVKRRIPRRE